MDSVVGNRIFVRQGVATALYTASEYIGKKHPSICVKVVYGYRSLKIQNEEFDAVKKQLISSGFMGSKKALAAAAHLKVAEPSVAGHVTGAAVDLELVDRKTDEPLDFGTVLSDLSQNSYEYSPYVDLEAQLARTTLTQAMKAAGFSGFLGEWWHFMLGDREDTWAKHLPFAVYGPIDFSDPYVSDHITDRPIVAYKPFNSQLAGSKVT
jgi:D-alanyl-D-alanine dipeptidase